jgi:uncharacterized LabA/DUF88 family protein
MKTALVLVDVNNLYFNLDKKCNRRLDYKNYLASIREKYHVHRAYAYGVTPNDEAIKFVHALKKIGFEPEFIEIKVGESFIPDWAVTITLAAVRAIDRVDAILIGSSDRKLIPLYRWLAEKSIESYVYACGVPKAVREVVNTYQEIEDSLLLATVENETPVTT